MVCPKCKKQLPDDSFFCQFCGNAVKEQKTNNGSSLKIWIALLLTAVVVLGISLCSFLLDGDTQQIYFTKTGISLNVGDSAELESYILPNNATDKFCAYISSDEDIVSVDEHKVTGVNAGTAIITAVQNGISYGQCMVTVKHIEPANMVLNTEDDPIVVNVAREFEIPLDFEPSNVSDKDVSVEIDNPEIAEVHEGKIVGLVAGETVVKVRHRSTDLALSFNLKVEPVLLESFSIDIPKSIKIGDEIPLSTKMNPEDTTDKEFKWSSSSACAVIEDGKLIGKKEGTVKITAKHSSGLKETIEVVVSAVPIDKISLKAEKGSNTIEAGSSIQLVPSYTPANATATKLTWSSSNTSVAKVDGNGKVVGVSAGTASITVKTADEKTSSYMITVKPKPIQITNSWVVKPSAYCCCPMEIDAPLNESVYVFFKEDSSSSRDFGVLVKAGSTFTFDAPTGNYTLYYASGKTWYGKDFRFGDNTTYEKGDTKLKNYIDGDYAYGHTLTLYGVYNGNMDSDYIPESQFPG